MEALGLRGRLSASGVWALLGTLLALIAVNLPELGSDPWPFKPGTVTENGILGPLVSAADGEWDLGIPRSACFLAGLGVALLAAVALVRREWPAWAATAVAVLAALALLVPATFLQVGLRDNTEPWFFTNDSTYQIELGGDLLLDGENPYGHDYRFSGMERFYPFDGRASEEIREREVALRHYAYFPGTVVTAAAWRGVVPAPFDDFRVLVLLFTLGGLFAVLAFRGPLEWRLALGVLVACNPIAVRSAWFGQNDAPSLTLMILAFALATRGRWRWAAASLAAAVLMKQFAVVALPFLAIFMLHQGAGKAELRRAGLVFAGLVALVSIPFLIADPGAFWDDTVRYGAGTYKIVGYGLSAMLVESGILADRDGSYPFALIAVLTWLPLTAWLLLRAWRSREPWVPAVGFTISILVLLFIGRTFNNYYLVWPLTGAVIAAATAIGAASSRPASSEPPPAAAASG